jgi:hypothetical protein
MPHRTTTTHVPACKFYDHIHPYPVTTAFEAATVNFHDALLLGKRVQSHLKSRILYIKKLLTHLKTTEHVIIYCSLQMRSQSYTSIKSQLTNPNVTPF